jgi:putative CocE/NonD family hydrolase
MFRERTGGHVPRKKDQGLRRKQIRDAALRILATRGLYDLKLRDIAEEAGLTPASVLYYYPELDDLLAEAFRHAIERSFERRREVVEGADDARERLVNAVRAGMPTGSEDAELLLLWEALPFERTSPAVADLDRLTVARQVDLYASILELGVAQGHFVTAGEPRTIAWNLLALEERHGLGVLFGHLPSAEEAERLVLSFASLATGCDLATFADSLPERRPTPDPALTTPIRVPEPLPYASTDPLADEVRVPMQDGTRLATDVYLPPGNGPFPTVLVRLPYGKSERFSFMPQIAPLVTERGYAFVVQDVRGKFRSEGDPLAFAHEVGDGRDTLEWISGQRWSDGAVGMLGDSYYGFTQWAAVAGGHPALRAIVPRFTTSQVGDDWMYHQDVFCLFTMAEWAATAWVDRHLYDFRPAFAGRPLADVVAIEHAGRRSASFDRWIGLPPADPFWTTGIYGTSDPVSSLRIPALHHGGWWDVFQRGQIADFLRATAAGAPDQHLVMDSADHFDDQLVPDGEPVFDIEEDDEALARYLPRSLGPVLAFFDRHLRGIDGGAGPIVRWHLANEGWRDATTWPPIGGRTFRRYLADGGRALAGVEGGALVERADRVAGEVRWTHDPGSPVPDLITDAWRPLLGLPDEREVEGRDDVLTFSGEPLSAPLDLAGPASVTAVTRAGGGSAQLAAKLVDVFPNGRARRILQGIARVSAGGGVVTVDLGHTGYRVRPGHQLRLELAASDFPRYLLDPGTDDDPWTATRTVPVERTIVVGGTEGAALDLTVL